ncbi:hypothetical protein WA158_004648 [Blastocystis sp. Blastoise]
MENCEDTNENQIHFMTCEQDPLGGLQNEKNDNNRSSLFEDDESHDFSEINRLLNINITLVRPEKKWNMFITKCEDCNIPETWKVYVVYDPRDLWGAKALLDDDWKYYVKSQKKTKYLIHANTIDQFFLEQTNSMIESFSKHQWLNTLIPLFICIKLSMIPPSLSFPVVFYKLTEFCSLYMNKLAFLMDSFITPPGTPRDSTMSSKSRLSCLRVGLFSFQYVPAIFFCLDSYTIIDTLKHIMINIPTTIPRLYLCTCLLPALTYSGTTSEFKEMYLYIFKQLLTIESPLSFIYFASHFVHVLRICHYEKTLHKDLETILTHFLTREKDIETLAQNSLSKSDMDVNDLYKMLVRPLEYLFAVYFHYEKDGEDICVPASPSPSLSSSFSPILDLYLTRKISLYFFLPLLKSINSTVFQTKISDVYMYVCNSNSPDVLKREIIINLGKYLCIDNNWKYADIHLLNTIWIYIKSIGTIPLYLQLLFIYIKVILKYYGVREIRVVVNDIYNHINRWSVLPRDLYRVMCYIFNSRKKDLYDILDISRLYYLILKISSRNGLAIVPPHHLYLYTISVSLIYKYLSHNEDINVDHKFFITIYHYIYQVQMNSKELMKNFLDKCSYSYKSIDNLFIYILYRYIWTLYKYYPVPRGEETDSIDEVDNSKETIDYINHIYNSILDLKLLTSKLTLMLYMMDICHYYKYYSKVNSIYETIIPLLQTYINADDEYVYYSPLCTLINQLSYLRSTVYMPVLELYTYIYTYFKTLVNYSPSPIKLNLYILYIQALNVLLQQIKNKLKNNDKTKNNIKYKEDMKTIETIYSIINDIIGFIYQSTKTHMSTHDILNELLSDSRGAIRNSSLTPEDDVSEDLEKSPKVVHSRGTLASTASKASVNGFDLEFDIDMNIDINKLTIHTYTETYLYCIDVLTSIFPKDNHITTSFSSLLSLLDNHGESKDISEVLETNSHFVFLNNKLRSL